MIPRAAMNIPVSWAPPWRATPISIMDAPATRAGRRPKWSQAQAQKGSAASWPTFWIAFQLHGKSVSTLSIYCKFSAGRMQAAWVDRIYSARSLAPGLLK